MTASFIDRIDSSGILRQVPEPEVDAALREGEAFHRELRPQIIGDYVGYLKQVAAEGAGMMQLAHEGEVRAIAIWRSFLTTYCGRRFEIDDLVTAAEHRSKGYGATLIRALEAKARSLSCDEVMLTSATWRRDAHRFYFRQRYAIEAFLFVRKLNAAGGGAT